MSHAKKKMKAKKKEGGKIHEYDAEGSPEVKEAKDDKEGFKKGGAKKKEGMAEGAKAHKRMDKHKIGGKVKKSAAGGSPFTEAKKTTPYNEKGDGMGHMGQGSDRDKVASDRP
jgi:hypothetical protein